MSVRDFRHIAFCWQDKRALAVIRAYYCGDRLKRRATALGLYLTLTEIASNQYSPGHAEATHRAIWEATGTSETTVKQYLREFVTIGLISVERQKAHATINLPNVYALLSPGATDSPTPATDREKGGAVDSPTPATDRHLQEERNLITDDQETDAHFIEWNRRNRGYAEAEATAIAARHTQDGKLNRGRFLGDLPRR